MVVQERDTNNLPIVTYTRGPDLSGALQEAGGIGGLLARRDRTTGQTTFYHADGNGNVTALISTAQYLVAKYLYDPFGNVLSECGPLAGPNLYRFSSKEAHENSGLIYYLYRFYGPNLQRWLNEDPIQESGGVNLHQFVENNSINLFDPFGLLDAISANGYWAEAAANGAAKGGFWGNAQNAGSSIMGAFIDFWGARTLQKNAEKSGAASGIGCTKDAWKYGALAAGQIAFAAGGQYAVNGALYPFVRFVGPGSRAGFGTGTWLARGPVGSIPYGSVANAALKLQIPTKSAVDACVRAEGVWYRYVAGPRVVSGNPQFGAGGGLEYRVGGFSK